MKVCFKCGIEKPLNEYYKHKGMADGHLNKCKDCTKKDTKERTDILSLDPNFVESERKRGREKYYRLNYKESSRLNAKRRKDDGTFKKYIISKKYKRESICRYNEKYPEKYKCKIKSQRLKAKIKGNNLHHWSYNLKHAKDVIELTIEDHNKIHRFLKYNQKTFMYKDLNGNLLDTKEKHLKYINDVIKYF